MPLIESSSPIPPRDKPVSPCGSYPLMAVATFHQVPYGLVLRYAESLAYDLTTAQEEALERELDMYPNDPARTPYQHQWMFSVLRAIREEDIRRKTIIRRDQNARAG